MDWYSFCKVQKLKKENGELFDLLLLDQFGYFVTVFTFEMIGGMSIIRFEIQRFWYENARF